MIVRILGEGQFEVPDDVIAALNQHDDVLEQAVVADDEDAFAAALGGLLDAVRTNGKPLDPAALATSALVLPSSDATIADVREMLGEEGLVPD